MCFEERSGLPQNQKLFTDDVVKRYLENAVVEVATNKKTVDKAPRFPLGVIAALDLMVSLLGKPPALKVVAWGRLWGAEDGRHATNQARGCGVDEVGFDREVEKGPRELVQGRRLESCEFSSQKERVW